MRLEYTRERTETEGNSRMAATALQKHTWAERLYSSNSMRLADAIRSCCAA